MKTHRSHQSTNEPGAAEALSVERLTFHLLQMIFLLATIGLVYWIIVPAAITTWTTLLGAFSDASG